MSQNLKIVAYVDESIHQTDAGIYLVAAAVVVSDQGDHARSVMTGLLGKGQKRLHWRDEDDKRQRKIIEAVGLLDASLLTYGCPLMGKRKLERARAICVDRMLWDLEKLDVDLVVFEARDPALNRRDERTIAHARRAGRASVGLRYEFESPLVEPMLWIPDAVAGATAAHLTGTSSTHFEQLRSGMIEIVHLRL